MAEEFNQTDDEKPKRRLLRRGSKEPASERAKPASENINKSRAERRAARKAAKEAEQPAMAASATDAESSGGGIVGWLGDTYNGLFKIVIQPQLPSLRLLALMVVALLFGMAWAYAIAPVEFYNASPNQLSSGQRDQYVRLVAASYQAEAYGDQETITLLNRIEEPGTVVQRLIQEEQGKNLQPALEAILPLAQQADPGITAPSSGNLVSSILTFVLAVIVFVLIANVFALLWGLLIGGFVERALIRMRPKTEADIKAELVRDDIRRRKALEVEMKQAASETTSQYGPPLTQRISTYTKGRAFDDSFAIEDANDNFLGECGATIAKTIGSTNELAAVELWLFDKEDFVRTLTKLLVTQHAYNDPALRAELDPKVENPATDIVIMQPGAVVELESKMIRMQTKLADFAFGTAPDLPPESHIESLTLQVVAWEKEGSATAIPAGGGLPSLDSYEIGPPPAMPATSQPPTMPAATPPPVPPPSGLPPVDSYEIGPPPAMPSNYQQPQQDVPPARPPLTPPDDDEDPFGGTGDFTPVGR